LHWLNYSTTAISEEVEIAREYVANFINKFNNIIDINNYNTLFGKIGNKNNTF
jgi:hypothetical protein